MRPLVLSSLLMAACALPGQPPGAAPADSLRHPTDAYVVYGRDLVAAGGTDLERSLASRVPGLTVVAWQGRSVLVLRGISTIAGDPSPLYVLDGVAVAPGLSPLRTMNPYDIDRIEVLRNSAETVRYHNAGGNGVIRIWTYRPPLPPPDSTDD